MKLSAHQLSTLRSILRTGGHAFTMTSNGRTESGYLRTTTCEGLRRAGFLKSVWTAKHTVTKFGAATHDYFYFVSAAGCVAVHEADMAEAEAAEAALVVESLPAVVWCDGACECPDCYAEPTHEGLSFCDFTGETASCVCPLHA